MVDPWLEVVCTSVVELSRVILINEYNGRSSALELAKMLLWVI
jgi:hypothetical protein